MIRTHVIAAVCGLLVLAFMLELLRRRQLREKYAILWLGVSLVVVVPGRLPEPADLGGPPAGHRRPA